MSVSLYVQLLLRVFIPHGVHILALEFPESSTIPLKYVSILCF